jgi:hypothetical protein
MGKKGKEMEKREKERMKNGREKGPTMLLEATRAPLDHRFKLKKI